MPGVTPAVVTLIDDLVQTMHGAPGVGLAALQVGLSERVFVIDLSGGTNAGRSDRSRQPDVRAASRHAA